MTEAERKARLRAHEASGNVPVRCWVPEHRKPEVDAMDQEAEQAVKQREGESICNGSHDPAQ